MRKQIKNTMSNEMPDYLLLNKAVPVLDVSKVTKT